MTVLERVDDIIRRLQEFGSAPIGESVRLSARLLLQDIRPLIVEAECKWRIAAAGFEYTDNFGCSPSMPIGLRVKFGPWYDFTTWPEAAAWAEAQAEQKRKKAIRLQILQHTGDCECGNCLTVEEAQVCVGIVADQEAADD